MNAEIQQALADALAPVVSEIETDTEIVVVPEMVFDPTTITLDIYPSDPFKEPLGFSYEHKSFWTVRARTGTAEHQGAQTVLLSLMEDSGPTAVAAALEDDQTLGGLADSVSADGPSGFTLFVDPASRPMLGVTWAVTVLNRPEPTT